MTYTTDDYKNVLQEAANALEQVENLVFTAMVNVGFAGVYKELVELHEPGEILALELPMFEHTGDQNLDTLIEALVAVANAKATLVNVNGLQWPEEDGEEIM